LGADRDVDWSRLRVAVSEDLGCAPVEPAVRSAFRAAIDRLADDGAAVTEACPDTGNPTELWNDTALAEGFASEGHLLDHEGIDDVTREIVEAGRSVTASAYLDAQERRREFTERWESFFEEYDVLLAPSLPIPAFGTDVTGPDRIDGTPIDPFFDDWCLLALPANLTGQPACAVPTGLSPDGLPVGMQVMGPRWSDSRVLAVAQRHELLTGFDLAPARVEVGERNPAPAPDVPSP
jgi:aspartyl-tRNA(Asn)/glutamyl-tRNA(Gln) amidotransferase subunit A